MEDTLHCLKSLSAVATPHEVVVVGLGEGSLIAPHFSRIINANKLVLINPLYNSYKENLTLAFTENTKNSNSLKQYFGFAYQNDWLDFFKNVNANKYPDKRF